MSSFLLDPSKRRPLSCSPLEDENLPDLLDLLSSNRKSSAVESTIVTIDLTDEKPVVLKAERSEIWKVPEPIVLETPKISAKRRKESIDGSLLCDEQLAKKLEKEETRRKKLEERARIRQEKIDLKLALKFEKEELKAAEIEKARKMKEEASLSKIIWRRVISGNDLNNKTKDYEQDYQQYLFDLEEDMYHIDTARQLFEKTARQYYPNIKIISVEYVLNTFLHERYYGCKEKFEMVGKPTNEILVFHGTASENIEPILEEGFKIGGVNGHKSAHGRSMGFGVYTATNPTVSLGYVMENKKLLLSKLLPGRTTSVPWHTLPPNDTLNMDNFGGADSYLAGDVRVIFRTEQLLPCYVINFEIPIPTVPHYPLAAAPFFPGFPVAPFLPGFPAAPVLPAAPALPIAPAAPVLPVTVRKRKYDGI